MPSTVVSNPSRSPDGSEEFDPRVEFQHDILFAIDDGLITSRDDVIKWLEKQGHKIGRKGKDCISLNPKLIGSDNPPKYGKHLRMRGDLFDERFTSLEWLKTTGLASEEERPAMRRDMGGAAELLEELKAKRAELDSPMFSGRLLC